MAKKQASAIETGQTQQAQRVGIFGASGSGKTYKARELTRGLGRVVFFDSQSEFAKKEKGVKVFSDLNTLKKDLVRNYTKGFRFAFVPPFGKEQEALDELSYFLVSLQTGYVAGKHFAQLTILVDELDESFPTGITLKNPQHGFAYLCKRGRNSGINIIGISQRTAQVDVCFRGNCSAIYFFRMADPIDIDKSIKMLGSLHKEKLRNLRDRQYILKSGDRVIHKA